MKLRAHFGVVNVCESALPKTIGVSGTKLNTIKVKCKMPKNRQPIENI